MHVYMDRYAVDVSKGFDCPLTVLSTYTNFAFLLACEGPHGLTSNAHITETHIWADTGRRLAVQHKSCPPNLLTRGERFETQTCLAPRKPAEMNSKSISNAVCSSSHNNPTLSRCGHSSSRVQELYILLLLSWESTTPALGNISVTGSLFNRSVIHPWARCLTLKPFL